MRPRPAAGPDPPQSWLADVAALLDGRRVWPTAAVAAALVTAELLAGFGWRGAAVALGMSLAFVLFAPAWYCRWFSPQDHRRNAARGLIYVSGCAVVVAALGLTLPSVLASRGSLLTDTAGWPVTMVLFAVGGWGLGRDILLARSLDTEKRRGNALAREVEHARLLAIQQQLDPHFLFNTLNAIAEWCAQDAQVAEAATIRLASMLRTMLGGLEAERWPLSDELALIEQLFALHQIRDPAQLSYSITGHTDAAVTVPTLLLLPLAENAMTHGPRAGHLGHVQVQVTVTDRVQICISNPGHFAGPRSGGRGVATVRRRLRLAYGADARFELGPCPDDPTRTRAQLSWPIEPARVAH